ncbi:MAG: 2-dehydro-3-deoxy-D-arabinonate dehydratase [Chloroflexota bacterium]|nr:2-dehydro-3-deoxy-D-arabinonate dehydratase [Chloroflexota bacterium]
MSHDTGTLQIVRAAANGRPAVRYAAGSLRAPLENAPIRLADLLRDDQDMLQRFVEAAAHGPATCEAGPPLAPIDGGTEVWAAGVTYKRSEEARVEESATPDIYTKVYRAQRPELFFKANARRVAGPGRPIVIRADSAWNVPEPELAVVANACGTIVGYTIANDVSSRSIEGENPLYLPQAKLYAGSCALGPGITPAWEVADPYALGIHMRIVRGGATCWESATSTSELHRRLDELIAYLFREDEFPEGVVLCTGTGLVPETPFTLEAGDEVAITIDGIGTLRNPVVRGKAGVFAQA